MAGTTDETAAAPSGAAAARSETDDAPKVIEWRGLTLELPPQLRGSLIFRYAAIENADENEVGPIVLFLEKLIGRDQVRQVEDSLDEVNLDDAAGELRTLVEDVLEQYGTGQGESPASTDS